MPDFIQAHFEEAPRLDNVNVAPPESGTIPTEEEALDLCARWWALKRLAIQAHDIDRELEFNAQEIRAERLASRWPRPASFAMARAGGNGSARSPASCTAFSRIAAVRCSVPCWWIIAIAFFAAFYLSQTEVMQRELGAAGRWPISASRPSRGAMRFPTPFRAIRRRSHTQKAGATAGGGGTSRKA